MDYLCLYVQSTILTGFVMLYRGHWLGRTEAGQATAPGGAMVRGNATLGLRYTRGAQAMSNPVQVLSARS